MGYSYNMFYFLKYSVTFLDILALSIRGEPHCKPLKTWHIRIPRAPQIRTKRPSTHRHRRQHAGHGHRTPDAGGGPGTGRPVVGDTKHMVGRCFRVVTFHSCI